MNSVSDIESVYENALFVALKQKGFDVMRQVPLKVTFRGVVVGDFRADMIVDGKVLIELKAVEESCEGALRPSPELSKNHWNRSRNDR